MAGGSTKGRDRFEKEALAVSVTSTKSAVTLTRNTARLSTDEVIFAYNFHRRGGPCVFHQTPQGFTLRGMLENPRKASCEISGLMLRRVQGHFVDYSNA